MSLIAIGAILLSAGCAVGAPREGTVRPTRPPAETRPPASATATPALGSRSASPFATGTPLTTTLPPTTARPTPPWAPPPAMLDGGHGPISGRLGSFCWHGLCGDVPRIAPKAQLPTLSFWPEDIELTLAGDAAFVRWFASYGAAEDGLEPLAEGGAPFDPDAVSSSTPPQLTSASFSPPPDGDWILAVQVFFTDGDAMYAWHATSD